MSGDIQDKVAARLAEVMQALPKAQRASSSGPLARFVWLSAKNSGALPPTKWFMSYVLFSKDQSPESEPLCWLSSYLHVLQRHRRLPEIVKPEEAHRLYRALVRTHYREQLELGAKYQQALLRNAHTLFPPSQKRPLFMPVLFACEEKLRWAVITRNLKPNATMVLRVVGGRFLMLSYDPARVRPVQLLKALQLSGLVPKAPLPIGYVEFEQAVFFSCFLEEISSETFELEREDVRLLTEQVRQSLAEE